jgi:uncharacterized protein YjeT (DUF2065 family)
MDWQILIAAIALMLIFEGLAPFASPDFSRRMYDYMRNQSNRSLRSVGALSIIAGLILLNVVGHG